MGWSGSERPGESPTGGLARSAHGTTVTPPVVEDSDIRSFEGTDDHQPTWVDRSAEGTPGLDDPRFESTDDPRIPPNKERFKIGEVARIVGVKPYVLRYWESEFPWVVPEKTDSGQRRYGRADVAALLKVRRLRHDEKLSIARTRLIVEETRRTGREVALPGSTAAETPGSAWAEVDRAFVRRRLTELRQAAERLMKVVEE